mmetsp:Transcript_27368/g.87961  ORF Transcript_27368/g.87961 Transcript_27368/m.87961 type:complete len:210 (+) Transcript_27368:921-1550(+)
MPRLHLPQRVHGDHVRRVRHAARTHTQRRDVCGGAPLAVPAVHTGEPAAAHRVQRVRHGATGAPGVGDGGRTPAAVRWRRRHGGRRGGGGGRRRGRGECHARRCQRRCPLHRPFCPGRRVPRGRGLRAADGAGLGGGARVRQVASGADGGAVRGGADGCVAAAAGAAGGATAGAAARGPPRRGRVAVHAGRRVVAVLGGGGAAGGAVPG